MHFNFIKLIIISAILNSPFANAKQWQVANTNELNAAIFSAKKFDSILVSGFYCFTEALVISKPLFIIGHGFPSFDFQQLSGGLHITADSVDIRGLNIYNIKRSSVNDYAGIYATDVSYLHIEGNAVYNAFFGIYLAKTKNSIILNNLVEGLASNEQNTGNAIHLWQCDNIRIDENMVMQHRDGIYLEFVTNSIIINNTSTYNIRYGLHFMFSHHDVYRNNRFIKNEAGVAVMYSNNVLMESNFFIENWGDCSYGLLLKDIYDGALLNNVFIQNTIALHMEGTNRLRIEQNTFSNNGWALRIAANCEKNAVENNFFSGNSFDVATNGNTVLNSFTGNYWDHYEGYDLDRNGIGDIPYHPVSLFSVLVERVPESLMLYRSFLTFLLDKSEHVMPSITPNDLVDNQPLMKPTKPIQEYAQY